MPLNIASFLPFVKQQEAFHAKRAARKDIAATPQRHRLHIETAKQFNDLARAIEEVDAQTALIAAQQTAPRSPRQLSLLPDDIKDLPDELVKELSLSEGDKTDFLILGLIEEAGGALSLDRILIGLWRKTGEVHKRVTLNSRLYRMTTKGAIFTVPGRKGAYSTSQLSEEEAQHLV